MCHSVTAKHQQLRWKCASNESLAARYTKLGPKWTSPQFYSRDRIIYTEPACACRLSACGQLNCELCLCRPQTVLKLAIKIRSWVDGQIHWSPTHTHTHFRCIESIYSECTFVRGNGGEGGMSIKSAKCAKRLLFSGYTKLLGDPSQWPHTFPFQLIPH